MKNILESPDTLAIVAEIDYYYFLIEEANKKFNKPITGIELMIDKATGYDKERTNQFRKTLINYVRQIIKRKKKIEADYSADEKFLEELKAINP